MFYLTISTIYCTIGLTFAILREDYDLELPVWAIMVEGDWNLKIQQKMERLYSVRQTFE